MILDIVLPTRKRKEKLDACLNSIFHAIRNFDVKLHIYFSEKDEYEAYSNFFEHVDYMTTYLLDNYRVPEFWNSHIQKSSADAMCYVNDDVLFFKDTVEVIIEEFSKKFPDYDGVMGLNQSNLPKSQTVEGAFGVIGAKYAERFPDKKVWCPDYDRFYADFELWKYAQSIDKFYFCNIAQITHLHPVTDRKLEDETHKHVRKWLSGDKRTFNLRKHRDLLWGQSFELLNKEM